MTDVIYNENKGKLEVKAADIIKEWIHTLLQSQKTVVLAIPGGRSVSNIFQILKQEEINWSKVHIFMVDERLVTIDNKESNFKLARESFLNELADKGLLPVENIHPFIMDESKDDYGIKMYEDELKKYGGIYDIILLSSGEDGHVGALYPNHHSIINESEYYIKMEDSPKFPKKRMTMSKKLLLRSKAALLLFFGEGKREAYKKLLDENIDYKTCPAKLVQQIKNSYVITDLKGD